jgi:RimJ/RimL family protein N-acetyltransferase
VTALAAQGMMCAVETAILPLRTGRLVLEPQVRAHAPEMFRVLSDPAIYEHENEPPASLEWLEARFARLESRRSPNGAELWLNWVARTGSAGLAGYVQATVSPHSRALIAYVFASPFWGHGLATEAVRAVIRELETRYHVHSVAAVLKRGNHRSLRLLERLGFRMASPRQRDGHHLEPDELLMTCRVGHALGARVGMR